MKNANSRRSEWFDKTKDVRKNGVFTGLLGIVLILLHTIRIELGEFAFGGVKIQIHDVMWIRGIVAGIIINNIINIYDFSIRNPIDIDMESKFYRKKGYLKRSKIIWKRSLSKLSESQRRNVTPKMIARKFIVLSNIVLGFQTTIVVIMLITVTSLAFWDFGTLIWFIVRQVV